MKDEMFAPMPGRGLKPIKSPAFVLTIGFVLGYALGYLLCPKCPEDKPCTPESQTEELPSPK
jgi:hypothetical protein